MTNPKLETFRAMVRKNPDNALARFGLANEAMKAGEWEEAREQLELYLASHDDEGNGYGRLAEALVQLDRTEEATDVLKRGIAAALEFGHPTMAGEFEARIAEMDDA